MVMKGKGIFSSIKLLEEVLQLDIPSINEPSGGILGVVELLVILGNS